METIAKRLNVSGMVVPVAFLAALSVLAAWLLPNHYFPWVTAYQEFAAFLALLLLWGLVVWEGFRIPVIALLFVAVAVVPILQWWGGGIFFFGDAFTASIYLVGFAIALAIGHSLRNSPFHIPRVLSSIGLLFILAGIISVWITLRQWMMFPGSIWFADVPPGGRPFANFAQPNNLAIFLCMGLMAVIYFFETRQLGRISSAFVVLFLIMGVVLSESRTPWVVAFVLCLFWCFRGRHICHRLKFEVLLAWVACYVLLVIALPFLADALLLNASSFLERAQGMHRWGLWKQLSRAVFEGPWWGYGWNQVSVAQVAVSTMHPVGLMTEHSHNIVLDVLLWNGPWLGSLLVIMVAAWFIWLLVKAKNSEELFAVLVALCLLIHGMLEYPLEYAFFLLPMGLLLGTVRVDDNDQVWVISMPRSISFGLLMFSIGLFVWVWHEYRVIEEDSRLMRFETAGIGQVFADQAAPDVVLLTQLREFNRFARSQASEDMTQQELDWMGSVATRYPYPPSLFRYALALALNGKLIEANQQLLILHSLHQTEHYDLAMEGLKLMSVQYPVLKRLISDQQRYQVID